MKTKTLKKTLTAAAVITAATMATTQAKADQSADWMKVLVEADRFVRTGSTENPQLKLEPKRSSHQLSTNGDPSPQNMGNAWFGVAPKVTLVARDWTSSTRLLGDKMGFTENLRLAESTRMVVGRVRLNSARFTPFMQIGLGQWRADRRYVPTMQLDVEVAGQLGSGFELRVAKNVQVAAELSATTLIRYDVNDQQPQNVLWSALIASRVQF